MRAGSSILLALLCCCGVGLMLTGKKWLYWVGFVCSTVAVFWFVAGMTR